MCPTEPTSAAPSAAPTAREIRLEGLRREFRAALVASPDERLAIPDRAHEWARNLKPNGFFEDWLVDQASALGLRIDRLQRIERRQRLRRVLRAAFFWDDDRRLEAEQVGSTLADDPPAARAALEQTPQGSDWLIGRWAHLAGLAEKSRGWSDRDRLLASDLLGVARSVRGAGPATRLECLALARREIGRLEAIKAGPVGDLDAFDRANAESDLVDDPSPEAARVRRELAAHHHRLRWNLQQLKSPIEGTSPSLDYLETHFPRRQSEPIPAPEPETPAEPEEVDVPLAPPIPSPPRSRRQRRANATHARQSGRQSDPCPS